MDKLDELERKLNYTAIKSRFWGRPSSIEEQIELRKITRKKIDEINRSKMETKER